METWVWLIIGLVVGIGIGAVAALLIRRSTGSQRSIADLKKENEQFREEVSGHFVETARLINRMTDSYKDVFDHLSRGAETLVDDKSLRERMPLVSGREVRLKHLGTQAGSGPAPKGPTGTATSAPARDPAPVKPVEPAASPSSGPSGDPLKSAGTRANDKAGIAAEDRDATVTGKDSNGRSSGPSPAAPSAASRPSGSSGAASKPSSKGSSEPK